MRTAKRHVRFTLLVAKYPAAASLKETDIADPSFVEELEQNGFIDGLYAAGAK